MKTWRKIPAAVAAVVLAAGPLAVGAQEPLPGGAQRAAMGPGVEGILRMRERLELTEEQVRGLDALRQEAVARRVAHRSQMEELRSRLRAGDVEAAQVREAARERRAAALRVREQEWTRVQEVLSESQRQAVREMDVRMRAFRRGRASALDGGGGWPAFGRGRPPGGRPGFAPFRRGPRQGPGFGPRRGRRGR